MCITTAINRDRYDKLRQTQLCSCKLGIVNQGKIVLENSCFTSRLYKINTCIRYSTRLARTTPSNVEPIYACIYAYVYQVTWF